jgi:mono/diheme cytochrome c family protein
LIGLSLTLGLGVFSVEGPMSASASPVRFLDAKTEAREKSSNSPMPLSRLRVFDPYEQGPIEFEGEALPRVLDRVYGPDWRKLANTHQLRMKCRDGYRLSVPLSRILKHQALIAVRRLDQPDFTLLKKDVTPSKRVELGPAYLVWENERDLAIRSEGDYGWPFQWDEASLERLGEGEALLLPSKSTKSASISGAPTAAALRGYAHFKVHCMKCHSIAGVGGRVGPELHHPMNVTRYWRPGFLEKWILNPASFRIPNGMPPLAPAHPDRVTLAREIVEYLSSLPSSVPPSVPPIQAPSKEHP